MNARLAAMAAVIAACAGVAALVFWLAGRKFKRSAGLILAGALGFFVTQGLVRIPLLQVFGSRLNALGSIASVLILGVSAAVFETSGRVAAARLTRERSASPAGGMLLGLGHGLCEMFVLLVGAYVNNIVLLLTKNAAASEIAAQVRQALAATPLWMFAVAFGERLMAIAFHTLMSVLVVKGFLSGKQAVYILAVIALHASFDIAVMFLSMRFGAAKTEIFIAAAAVCCLAVLLKIPGIRGAPPLPADEAAQAAEEGY